MLKVYKDISKDEPDAKWCDMIWLAIHGRLLTQDRMSKWSGSDVICGLPCKNGAESKLANKFLYKPYFVTTLHKTLG